MIKPSITLFITISFGILLSASSWLSWSENEPPFRLNTKSLQKSRIHELPKQTINENRYFQIFNSDSISEMILFVHGNDTLLCSKNGESFYPLSNNPGLFNKSRPYAELFAFVTKHQNEYHEIEKSPDFVAIAENGSPSMFLWAKHNGQATFEYYNRYGRIVHEYLKNETILQLIKKLIGE